MKSLICLLLGVAVTSGLARASHATEPLVPQVTKTTLEGEWEGAWRARIAGELVVFYLRVFPKAQTVFTIASGPLPNVFLESFDVSSIECAAGRVELKGIGIGDARGESLTIIGNGWAQPEDGFLDVSIRKVTRSGKTLTFDLRLNKLGGGFFKNAEKLVQVAKKRPTKSN
ncbi:MAG TPA: hypothetical protein VN903_07155 [Polyangia bacterium]|jgi:hypothetical protein|nr:hypothetical protein [Polyangia bacterium]